MPDRVVRFILTGSSAGAVKAMEETAAASERTDKTLKRTGRQAESSFAKTEKAAKRLHGAVGGLLGTVGIGGLAFGISDVVKAGVGWQQQQAQLQQSLKDTGIRAAGTIGEINKAVEESSTHGGFNAQEETGGIAQLIRLTHSATKAISLNREAVLLARGAHEDYGTALSQVERIQTGQVGRLQKLIGVIIPVKRNTQALAAQYAAQVQSIKAATKGNQALQQSELAAAKQQYQTALIRAQTQDKQATAAQANTLLLRKFGGATRAYSNTAAGAISNATNSFHLLAETIGRTLLPPLTAVAKWMGRNRTAAMILIGVLASLAVVVGVVKVATATYEAVTIAASAAQAAWTTITEIATAQWWALNFAMEANPIGLVIVAIAALIAIVVLVVTHFRLFKTVVAAVWNWLKGAVVTVVNFVAKHWKLLAIGALALAGPFIALPVYVATHFKQVKKLVEDVVNWIASKFKWLGHIMGAPFRAVGGVIGKIAHVGGSIGHFITHPFGLATGGLVPAFATGGFVGSGTDTVPAMLSPGEYVLRAQAVRALGVRNVQQLNDTGTLGVQIQATTTPIVLDGRPIAEAVTHYVAKRTARR